MISKQRDASQLCIRISLLDEVCNRIVNEVRPLTGGEAAPISGPTNFRRSFFIPLTTGFSTGC